jgi:hypothetical protein
MMSNLLFNIASSITSPVESRLIREYGAIFLTKATPPPTLIFADSEQVESFQSSLSVASSLFGEHSIELQSIAMDALVSAQAEIQKQGGTLSARAADSGRRSYEDTVKLWTRNVTRGIERWQAEGRISARQADAITALSVVEQVAVVLDLEDNEQLYFGTFFDKSILYSVAAPGASQHLAMLAFDVAEFEDDKVEKILGEFGWHRTVVSDFPHFTYLGYVSAELPALGLQQVSWPYKGRDYWFWVPKL